MSYPKKSYDNSIIYTYREQIILDPMILAMEQSSNSNKSSFFGQQFDIPSQSNNKL